MDGFVLILAIIIFSVFRNFIAETKKRSRDLPDGFDADAEQEEARERALDALRQWEAKQRRRQAEAVDRERSQREPVRIRRPGEHRTDVRLAPTRREERPFAPRQPRPFSLHDARDSEQTRREAYDAIREMLAGKTERPAPPVPEQPEETRPPATRAQAGPKRVDQRTPALRPRIRGTIRSRVEAMKQVRDPAPAPPGRDVRAPAGLARLEGLPPLARGLLYAELLGTPIALRTDEPIALRTDEPIALPANEPADRD